MFLLCNFLLVDRVVFLCHVFFQLGDSVVLLCHVFLQLADCVVYRCQRLSEDGKEGQHNQRARECVVLLCHLLLLLADGVVLLLSLSPASISQRLIVPSDDDWTPDAVSSESALNFSVNTPRSNYSIAFEEVINI